MMGFLPNLYRIKCIWDSLNSTNNPQKSEFQEKGGEETNNVKENIPENLGGNKIVVEIRAKNVIIKEGRKANERGIWVGKKKKKNNLKER